MKIVIRVVLAVIGLALGIAAVFALREATLSTHQRVEPGSQIELVVNAHTRGAERSQSLEELVQAQLAVCRLEVNSDVVSLVEEDDDRFRAILEPSMDETDRRQFRGCVEDWLIDHVRLNVVTMDDIA
jgi:hypothetical protein